ncbi:MAG: hypothetical protein VYB44_07060 [Bacteroidota bacterium]|nr:hypothetical protein [Bacteroidota bacterium]
MYEPESSFNSLEQKYLDPYLGNEQAWHIGFYKRFKDYNGPVATLRRASDSATHDIYYSGDEVDWADPVLLSFLDGQVVDAYFYNQVPVANRAFDIATSSAGSRPIIYNGGFKTATGHSQFKVAEFNGSSHFLLGNTSSWTTSQESLYQIMVGEYISGTYAQSFAHVNASASWQAMILGSSSIGGSLRTEAATTTVTTPYVTSGQPSIIGYQERSYSRSLSINGNEVLNENTNHPLNGTNSTTGVYFGRLRGRDLIMWGGKMIESLGFFDIKDTIVQYQGQSIPQRLAIERIINKTYQF